jgi:hypothetical protein
MPQSKKAAGRPGGSTKAAERRARAEAAKAALRAAERRRRQLTIGLTAGAVVVVAALVVVLVVVVQRDTGKNTAGASASASAGIPSSPRTTAAGRTSSPPWPAPADATAATKTAGLPMLGAEGTVEHIHAHLDVIVDGKAVTVPAEIGIDEAQQQISPLHTHDTSGVIHIESPVKGTFSLGQFLTEWQVSVAADHLGGLTATGDKTLKAYVNGKAVTGDPAAIIMHAHDEIALVYGTAAEQQHVPSSYTFASGL